MELPKRKHPRLRNYDYSQAGHYYVTIHSEKGQPPLSVVEQGLAPAAFVSLTPYGAIAAEQLSLLEARYPYVRIEKHIVMPTHIHAIIHLQNPTSDQPRPSLTDIICTYKSLTTREMNRSFGTPGQKRFQTSFYESVLRNEQAYLECWQYIDNNPAKWLLAPEDL